MKRALLLILTLALAACFAVAEGPIPENAALVSETNAGAYRISVYDDPDTGEQLTLTEDIATGRAVSLHGARPSLTQAPPPDAASAKAMLSEILPDAQVVSSAEADAALRLNIIAPDFSGYALFDADGICERELFFSECMREGRLTMHGAVSVMALLRPDADLTEIELDEDDGLLLFEGEAFLDGVEYEFELDARTGRLLQWDRD